MPLLALIFFFVLNPQPLSGQTPKQTQYIEIEDLIYPRLSESLARAAQRNWPIPSPAAASQHIQALHNLVVDTVIEALHESPPPKRIDTVTASVRNLQGDAHKNFTKLPYSASSSIKGRDVVTVVFQVLRGGMAIPTPEPFIQFYMPTGNSWYLAAEAPQDLSGLGVEAQQLKSPAENEVWVLAWGRRYGDTGARRNVRLFAFDGASVRTLWQREGLLAGRIEVNENRITVTHRDPAYRERRITEEYLVIPQGLQRVH